MTEKSDNKTNDYIIYPETDTDGGVLVPKSLGNVLYETEKLVYETNSVGDYQQGIYFAVHELLSCPLAMIEEKAIELLSDIIDDSLEDNEDDEDEEDMKTVPNMFEDISDEELEAEFAEEENKEKNKMVCEANCK